MQYSTDEMPGLNRTETDSSGGFAIVASETLISEFVLLKEAPFIASDNSINEANNETKNKTVEYASAYRFKFTERSIDTLAKHLVCRHYANLSFELAHLCWAIVNTGTEQSVFEYFYIHEAVSSQRMKNYFERQSGACLLPHAEVDLRVKPDANRQYYLALRIHQHQFSIHCTRANLLAALFEWLVGFIPSMFELINESLFGKGLNAIQALASLLQKRIYDYLQEHLPPAKAQAKFYLMHQFLHAQTTNTHKAQNSQSEYSKQRNDNESSRFDDESILQLWKAMTGKEGMERYTTVVRSVYQYHEALDECQHNQALKFASDADELVLGESVFEALTSLSANRISLDELTKAPKLISQQQAQRLKLLADFPTMSTQLPLTFLRYVVFGGLQAKAIQAKRDKKHSTTREQLLLAESLEEGAYADLCQKLKAQLVLNEQTYYAVLHILKEAQSPYLIELLASNDTLLNEVSSRRVAQNSQEPALSKIDEQALLNTVLNDPELNQRAQKAFQQNKRQGFTKDSILPDLSVYLNNMQCLLNLNKCLLSLQKNMQKRDEFQSSSALDDKYRADGFIFMEEFAQRMKS